MSAFQAAPYIWIWVITGTGTLIKCLKKREEQVKQHHRATVSFPKTLQLTHLL